MGNFKPFETHTTMLSGPFLQLCGYINASLSGDVSFKKAAATADFQAAATQKRLLLAQKRSI